MLAMLCREARMPRAQATAWMPEVEQCREQLPDAQERPPSPRHHRVRRSRGRSYILGRHKFEKKVAPSRLSVDQLVEGYAQLAALVRPTSLPRLAPAPDDDVVLGTALAANAEFIVTGDRTLRSLVEYQNVKLVRVRDALQTLQS